MKKQLSPSMMCADFFHLGDQLREFEENGIEYLHIDIMDGVFVPNYTLGTDFVKRLKSATSIPLDIHLMIERPEERLAWFTFGEGDYVSVHAETTKHLERVLSAIRARGARPMVAINPATPLSVLDYVLDDIDAVLVETLRKRYGGAVRALYDPDAKRAAPLDADIVFSTVVYEDQTLPDYTTERLSARSLVAVLYYGYGGLFISNEKKTPFLPNIVLAWRYFVSNEATRRMNVEKNPLLAANAVVVGYAKMDRLATIPRREGGGKTILLCPHHTLEKIPGELSLSTFLKNADLYQRLPEMFPGITFVFRPHPLLFPRLATAKWWGAERTAAYERAMEAHPNVVFQRGGDYFEAFRNSDALIHDCGSFLAEYFYTGSPQCYLLDGEATLEEQFLPFARTLAEHVRKGYTDEDVVSFVRDVAAGRDPDRESRAAFAAREVCVNHPDATSAVVAVLDAALGGATLRQI